MGRSKPDEQDDTAPTLRHNPFSMLKKDGSVPASSLEKAAPRSAPESRSPAAAAPNHGGAPARIVVRREKKGRGGKGVTIAEGAGLAGTDLDALARDLAKKLGAGARVEDGALVVQGEHVDRLVAALEAHGLRHITRGN